MPSAFAEVAGLEVLRQSTPGFSDVYRGSGDLSSFKRVSKGFLHV